MNQITIDIGLLRSLDKEDLEDLTVAINTFLVTRLNNPIIFITTRTNCHPHNIPPLLSQNPL